MMAPGDDADRGTSVRPESVDVVIPTKTPDLAWLDLTLGSLEMQTHDAAVTIVDCSPEPLTVDANVPVTVEQIDPCSTSGQRLHGVGTTGGDVVVHLDEDAVLTRRDHLERGLAHLDDPSVSGVGGRVAPIRGNRAGQLAASLSPMSAWFPMHRRGICPDGAACFPSAGKSIGSFYNDDWMLKRRLFESGAVVEDPDLVVLTDLPTRKQKTGAAGAGLAVLAARRLF